AASTIAFGKFKPKSFFGFAGGWKTLNAPKARLTCEAARKLPIVRPCAVSGSIEKRSGLTNRSKAFFICRCKIGQTRNPEFVQRRPCRSLHPLPPAPH